MNTIKHMVASVAPPIDNRGEPKSEKLIRLRGQVHDYDWGRRGPFGLVAYLAVEGAGAGFKGHPDHPYAELWMGTHTSGPLTLYSTPSRKLADVIASNPQQWLGRALLEKWPDSRDLPFVFKILSIAKALPLQAHPDKVLGAELHKRDPKQFVDANHKPEIAIALGTPVSDAFGGDRATTFSGFVGFAPLPIIRSALTSVPELVQAIGDELAVRTFVDGPSEDKLRAVFSALLVRGKEWPNDVAATVHLLFERTAERFADGPLATQFLLARRINEQYPGDVGVFAAPFFMNFVRLKKGEAVYIGADEAHAYLEGDIIECMAISDNVINAAFVPPEQRDLRTFTDMLTYTSREPSHWMLSAGPLERSAHGLTTKFSPPLEEFEVLHTVLGEKSVEAIRPARGPSIGIVVEGDGVTFEVDGERLESVPRGGIVFVAPGLEVTAEGGGEVWWATTNDLA